MFLGKDLGFEDDVLGQEMPNVAKDNDDESTKWQQEMRRQTRLVYNRRNPRVGTTQRRKIPWKGEDGVPGTTARACSDSDRVYFEQPGVRRGGGQVNKELRRFLGILIFNVFRERRYNRLGEWTENRRRRAKEVDRKRK
jgi:hypothetical protein